MLPSGYRSSRPLAVLAGALLTGLWLLIGCARLPARTFVNGSGRLLSVRNPRLRRLRCSLPRGLTARAARGGQEADFVYQQELTTPNQAMSLNEDLLDAAFELCETDMDGKLWCQRNYAGGYTSYATRRGQVLNTQIPAFRTVEQLIRPHLERFLAGLGNEDLRNADISDLQMKECWVNVMGPGTEHEMHDHPDSVVSGTYYVQTPPECAGICFQDERLGPGGFVPWACLPPGAAELCRG
eukprot:TRINITY_DN65155_c0_g1_i1.p1 TRINITY_DN65155_c0_g1~~TRINITY_DN65155_c0_g1_i1.p1  ORF type:complete len:240 (-),score=24.51 TRINITY_DN65155_c0_g1_i1:130-849(-)